MADTGGASEVSGASGASGANGDRAEVLRSLQGYLWWGGGRLK